MKKDLTELVLILDKSGSMAGLEDDTIGGYNAFIKKQKAEKGMAFVTTVLFSSVYNLLHDHVPIEEVGELTNKEYCPGGTTALLDALGTAITSVTRRIINTPEEERPEKVVFAVTTDGYENSSKEFNLKGIRKLIERRQKEDCWVFLFLGANIDAIEEATNLGMDARFARTYTNSSKGVGTVYTAMGQTVSKIRENSYATMDALSEAVAKDLDSVE